jgi:membrane protein YqaA with SNARE-associated domain
MEFQKLLIEWGPIASTFLVCFLSGFIPLINAELFLLAAALIFSKNYEFFIFLALMATAGQMLGKTLLYYSFFYAPIKKIEKIKATMNRWGKKKDLLLFFSAFAGFPPFYFVSIAAGIIHYPFIRFFALGFIGRLLRFWILLEFPILFKG